MLIIPALGRLRQEDQEFKACPGFITLSQKINNTTQHKIVTD
jgi:hypothetical protein